MSGLTVSKGNRLLEQGGFGPGGLDQKSMRINGDSSQIGSVSGPGPVSGKTFADTLKEAVASVNEIQTKADVAAQDLATGRTDNVADVMIMTEKADIALKLMMQVRNKIIDAYQEVMKMQV